MNTWFPFRFAHKMVSVVVNWMSPRLPYANAIRTCTGTRRPPHRDQNNEKTIDACNTICKSPKGSASDIVDDESPVTCPLDTLVDDADIVLSDLSASTIPWCACGVTSGAALRFIGWLFSGVLDGAWECKHMSREPVPNLLGAQRPWDAFGRYSQ